MAATSSTTSLPAAHPSVQAALPGGSSELRLDLPSKTKILCTLGPATSDVQTIAPLIEAGARIFRFNFSHGSHEAHSRVLANLRRAAQVKGVSVAVLQDLCGPKIRISHVADGFPEIPELGREVRITTDQFWSLENPCDVATGYRTILEDLQQGDPIWINDGRVRLSVEENCKTFLRCKVIQPGQIIVGKGINLPGSPLSTPSVTDKDWNDLRWGLENQVDFIALSFVRKAEDLIQVRDHLERVGSVTKLISKIERPEALRDIERIVQWSDGLMVARGDLAMETDYFKVPQVQKDLIRRCRAEGKISIVATQLLDSMVESSVPTRAEVSDIANAVLDGCDAVMLSNESAVGNHPAKAVEVLTDVAGSTETGLIAKEMEELFDQDSSLAAIAYSAAGLVRRTGSEALITYSQSGAIARQLSAMRLPVPIVSFTNVQPTERQLNLSFGVVPVRIDPFLKRKELIELVRTEGKKAGWWKPGGQVVFLTSTDGCTGEVDTLQVIRMD